MEQKFKQLQQKLGSLNQPGESHENGSKLKAKTLLKSLVRLQSRIEEDSILHDHKLNSMLDQLRKIEHILKQTHIELDIEGKE